MKTGYMNEKAKKRTNISDFRSKSVEIRKNRDFSLQIALKSLLHCSNRERSD